jgi:hypothetical protein
MAAMWEGEIGRYYCPRLASGKKGKNKTKKPTKAKRTYVVEHLPSKFKALSSNPSTGKKKKKDK